MNNDQTQNEPQENDNINNQVKSEDKKEELNEKIQQEGQTPENEKKEEDLKNEVDSGQIKEEKKEIIKNSNEKEKILDIDNDNIDGQKIGKDKDKENLDNNKSEKEEDNKKEKENEIEEKTKNEEIGNKEENRIIEDNKDKENKTKEENKIIEDNSKENNEFIDDNKDKENKIEEEKKIIEANKKEENNIEENKDKENKIKEDNKIIENNDKEENNKNEIQEQSEEENPNKIIENENDSKKMDESLKKRQEAKDNEKYLANAEEEKELQNLINEQLKNNDDEDEDSDEEEETFPFRFLGDVKKKGETLGLFNNRYLEIDSIKGLLKRYASSKEYPSNPMESIPIQNLKTLKKIKKLPGQEFYEFQITFIPPGKTKEKMHLYRVRHAECRTKWFESLLKLWKHLVKKEPLPPINKNKLIFIDDQVGINQEIKQHKKSKKKDPGPLVCLRNFKILSTLGVGGFGTVFKVQHILTEKIYAMKVMNKNYIIQKKYLHYVVSEFEIMKMLSGFPFVLDLHYCFQSANYLYMIIDICPNGDFTDIKSINNLKLFLAEVILAFEHIHNHNVVYRDLKPENILLDTTGHIKLCDFNLAKANVTKQKKATSFCGSPMYLSPEMLDPEGVDQRADIYGIGLLIYEIVTDKPAYMAANLNQLYEKIKANKINFNLPQLKGDLKDLLQKILVANPDDRITLEEIKRHPYFKDISFLKVYKKEYGPIVIKKKDASEINENDPAKIFSKNILEGTNEPETPKEKTLEEKKSEDEFKEQQKKLDADKEYSFLDGKISVREMKKDQKRAMKNYVREFYYVKKEDTPQTEEFTLTVNGILDTQGL